MKKITVVTPVFNEEATVRHCYETIRGVMEAMAERYEYEHIFADNCSTDRTLPMLREIAAADPRVKVLGYSRNFGAEKSTFTALKHASGDAVIGIPADLQEPPELIPKFAALWEQGYKVVYGVYRNPHEGLLLRAARRFYYWLIAKLSPDPLPRDFTGFAMLDRRVLREVVAVDDYAPYVRGIISSVGFEQIGVPYERPLRRAGKSKHGVWFLLGFGLNGVISHSIVPIRLATLSGLALSLLSFLMAVGYVVMKLINWNFQAPGATTTIALLLFFSGIQLLFLGVLGEYIGAIHSQVRRRPFVVIRERINFDEPRSPPTLRRGRLRRRARREAGPSFADPPR